MPHSRPTAAAASVVYLRYPGFARSEVADQARLKVRLEQAVATGIDFLGKQDRIVLEAPEGAVVLVLGDPEGALKCALLAHASDERLAVGLAHGPVRVVDSALGPQVLGDGITTAAAAATNAGSRSRIIAARDFRNALARFAPELARDLAPAGTFTDAQDRTHEIYFADPRAATERRRRFMAATAMAFGGIVALAIVARIALHGAGVIGQPATLRFDIQPRGEVIVDGVSKGQSPPLEMLSLPAGRYSIEVRNTKGPPLLTVVEVAAGEEAVIRHSFAQPQQARPAWRRFLDRFK